MSRSFPAAQTFSTSATRNGEEACPRKVKENPGRDLRERAGDRANFARGEPAASTRALTYLLHLVMVELREEVSEQMRGDHPAEARRRRVGKPRLERAWGRRAARSHSFVPERGGRTGSGESGRPTKRANSDGAPSRRVSSIWKQVLEVTTARRCLRNHSR